MTDRASLKPHSSGRLNLPPLPIQLPDWRELVPPPLQGFVRDKLPFSEKRVVRVRALATGKGSPCFARVSSEDPRQDEPGPGAAADAEGKRFRDAGLADDASAASNGRSPPPPAPSSLSPLPASLPSLPVVEVIPPDEARGLQGGPPEVRAPRGAGNSMDDNVRASAAAAGAAPGGTQEGGTQPALVPAASLPPPLGGTDALTAPEAASGADPGGQGWAGVLLTHSSRLLQAAQEAAEERRRQRATPLLMPPPPASPPHAGDGRVTRRQVEEGGRAQAQARRQKDAARGGGGGGAGGSSAPPGSMASPPPSPELAPATAPAKPPSAAWPALPSLPAGLPAPPALPKSIAEQLQQRRQQVVEGGQRVVEGGQRVVEGLAAAAWEGWESAGEIGDRLGLPWAAEGGAGAGGGRPRFPNRQKLSSVRDFFSYAEEEGRRLFQEMDADGDGQVRLEDLERIMRQRRLPPSYARLFLRRVRRHWLAPSFGWREFHALMEAREPALLRAFTSLSLRSSGTLSKTQVRASLERAGLPASDASVRAMMRFLGTDADKGRVTYGHFRNFLLLLPPERLEGQDASMIWFESATMIQMGPPRGSSGGSVVKSALAGGLASGLSTCLMHPLDTVKTRVQASSASLGEVLASVPSLGITGLYRGAVPAIVGQFASHGLRTGAYEASRLLLTRVAPHLTEYQVQPVASFCSTVLGTALRIPCEVLKQRLQAGMFDNTAAALRATLREEGPKGLFRGTTATLFREVPFFVLGMMVYLQIKRGVKAVIKRDLAAWETLLLGGVSGGLAAVAITPFDVIKTRMMVASPGAPTGLIEVGFNIAKSEGVGALYKGALPRFFWIAPLGAMNFAGYELAKNAIDGPKE